MSSVDLSQWECTQVFGDKGDDEQVCEEDVLSALQFDATGEHLALGDQGGRIVLLSKRQTRSKSRRNSKVYLPTEYQLFTEFESHAPEFDYLKSLEIEERIVAIKFLRYSGQGQLLLTTNEKTVKLWHVQERRMKKLVGPNIDHTRAFSKILPSTKLRRLKMPKLVDGDLVVSARAKIIFGNTHSYRINSIAMGTDGETFLTADDLRVNLWNMHVPESSFTVVDIKPDEIEELTDVISCIDHHPSDCNVFLFGSTKGSVRLVDLRTSAKCHDFVGSFDTRIESSEVFMQFVASVSDAKFVKGGQYIMSRDYLTLKLWDVRNSSEPVKVIGVHDFVRKKLCDMFDKECLFDKFECCSSPGDSHFATGSYKNIFYVFNEDGQMDSYVEATKQPRLKKSRASFRGRWSKRCPPPPTSLTEDDYYQRIMQIAWHPRENVIACAASNNLFLYHPV